MPYEVTAEFNHEEDSSNTWNDGDTDVLQMLMKKHEVAELPMEEYGFKDLNSRNSFKLEAEMALAHVEFQVLYT